MPSPTSQANDGKGDGSAPLKRKALLPADGAQPLPLSQETGDLPSTTVPVKSPEYEKGTSK